MLILYLRDPMKFQTELLAQHGVSKYIYAEILQVNQAGCISQLHCRHCNENNNTDVINISNCTFYILF